MTKNFFKKSDSHVPRVVRVNVGFCVHCLNRVRVNLGQKPFYVAEFLSSCLEMLNYFEVCYQVLNAVLSLLEAL